MQYLKFVFFAAGFVTLMITNFVYNNRTAGLPDRSTPYNKQEQKLRLIGYGCFALAILLIVIFN